MAHMQHKMTSMDLRYTHTFFVCATASYWGSGECAMRFETLRGGFMSAYTCIYHSTHFRTANMYLHRALLMF